MRASTLQNKLSEAAVCRCSSKQLLLKFAQYSQENICVGLQVFVSEYCEIFKNNFFYRISLLAISDLCVIGPVDLF